MKISTMPIELKREAFSILSAELRRQITKQGQSEDEILEDFSSWRKSRRETPNS